MSRRARQACVQASMRYTRRPMSSSSAGSESSVWPRSRALVTGGAGFIGSALVWGLNQRGCADVVIADFAAPAERTQNLRGLRFSEYIEPGTLLARLSRGSLGKFDFVFHLGACSSTTETDTDYLRRNNYEFSRDLAAWALSAGGGVLYASSAGT